MPTIQERVNNIREAEERKETFFVSRLMFVSALNMPCSVVHLNRFCFIFYIAFLAGQGTAAS